MAGFRVRERIAWPRDEVWDFIVDFKRASEWMPGVEELRIVRGDEPLGMGSRIDVRARGGEARSVLTAWNPPHSLALTSRQREGAIEATYTYSLAEIGSETEAELRVECRAEGLWRIVEPALGLLMRRSDGKQLRLLAEALRAQRR